MRLGRSAYFLETCTGVRSAQMPERGLPDPSWFEEDELETCPFCGAKAAIRNDSRIGICLACAVLWIKAAEPHAA